MEQQEVSAASEVIPSCWEDCVRVRDALIERLNTFRKDPVVASNDAILEKVDYARNSVRYTAPEAVTSLYWLRMATLVDEAIDDENVRQKWMSLMNAPIPPASSQASATSSCGET